MELVAEVRSSLAEWSPGLVGSCVFGLAVGQLVFDSDRLAGDILEVAVPLGIGLALIGMAVWLTTAGVEGGEAVRLAAWSALGFGMLLLLGGWEAFLTVREGRVPVDELGYRVVTTAATGALVGAIVGYYDLRRREAESEARLAQRAVETSRDGIAVVAADGTLRSVNGAFDDLFGRDGESLLGESVDACFAGAEFADVREEIETTLREDGEWRGEVRGVREDGGVFPADISLASLSDRDAAAMVVRDVSERKHFERTIRSLNGVSRDLMGAESESDVCELVVQTGRILLDRDLAGIWLHEDGTLRPEAVAGEAAGAVGDVVVTVGDGSHMSRAYRTQETVVRDRIEGRLDHADTDVLDSSVFVPLGEHGVLVVASGVPEAFDEDDLTLAELLGADATAALNRANRERRLQRQADRMEFFNSILRHDVLNGLTVIRTRADVLSRADDPEVREQAGTILEWCSDVSDIVSRVRRVIETLSGEGETTLEPVDLRAVVGEELDRLRSTYPEVDYEVSVPEGTWVSANELLGEVVGNVMSNALEHNDPEGLSLSVQATSAGDTVELRIADTGTGIDDEDKEAVFRRGETGHAKSTGSGFGLFFVDSMVEEYGGAVRVEDNEPTGAAFVITFDAASEH